MMVRADMGNVSPCPLQFIHGYAAFIHICIFTVYLISVVDLCQLSVSRIFNAIFQIRSQKLDKQAIQILRSCPYDDLIRIHQHPAKGL